MHLPRSQTPRDMTVKGKYKEKVSPATRSSHQGMDYRSTLLIQSYACGKQGKPKGKRLNVLAKHHKTKEPF